jgi:hypothetical protein
MAFNGVSDKPAFVPRVRGTSAGKADKLFFAEAVKLCDFNHGFRQKIFDFDNGVAH